MKKQNPVMTMIVQGRRALGEDWNKVTVTPNVETGQYDIEREPTAAPPDNTAIFVPALGNLSIEAADYILEYKRKDQEYRRSNNLPVKRGWSEAEITRMFHEWLEFKKKMFKGQTQSGPKQTFQREKVRSR